MDIEKAMPLIQQAMKASGAEVANCIVRIPPGSEGAVAFIILAQSQEDAVSAAQLINR